MNFRRRLLPVATWVVALGVTTPCFALDVATGFVPDPSTVNGIIIISSTGPHTTPDPPNTGVLTVVAGGAPNTISTTNGGSIAILTGLPSFPTTGLPSGIVNTGQFNASQFNTSVFNSAAGNINIVAAGVTIEQQSTSAVSIFAATAPNLALSSGANLGFTAPQVFAPQSPSINSFTSPAGNTASPVVAQFTTPTFVNFGVPTDKTNFKFNLQSEKPLFEKGKKNNPLLKTLNYTRNPYQPVAAGVPRALPFMQLSAIDRDHYSVRHDGTAQLTTNDSAEVGIKSGSIFVVAHKPIVITHNDLRVSLGAGAIVHVSASSNCLVVRTLHDKHMKDVNVSFAKESLAVPVGTELCIGTDENAVLEEINKDTMVRRSSLGTKLSSGKFGLTSTFPLHSMLAHPMLVNMYRNRIEDRPHIEKLMRMAACLHLIGRNSH